MHITSDRFCCCFNKRKKYGVGNLKLLVTIGWEGNIYTRIWVEKYMGGGRDGVNWIGYSVFLFYFYLFTFSFHMCFFVCDEM